MRFVSIGEAMIELAPLASGADYKRGFAGDTFNTAWYMAQVRPDWSVDFVTAIGRDVLSDSFCEVARAAGIGMHHVFRHADRTLGLYLIELHEAERSFHYWRENSAARTLADDADGLTAALRSADLVYFSGITLAILDSAARQTLMEVVTLVRSAGARVAFDPNLRPRLWKDADTMRDAIMAGAAIADVVLPSFDEEAVTFGDTTPEDTIARYRRVGPTCVVVKNGEGPVHFACGDATGRVVPDPAANVVDTTAAGDSFNAAFLANYLDGAGAAVAVKAACQLSGHVVGHRGALVELP